MHKSVVSHHRGETRIIYCNYEESLNEIRGEKYDLLILDSNLPSIYTNLLKDLSFIPNKIFVDPGESTKSLSGVFSLLNQIDELDIYPINNVLISGGATIQDTCATAMALLKRGTKWTYLPTTLLAQSDSCIGSKTSINSNNAKNLYGLFYSPNNIYVIPEFLKTLPDIEILSGIGDAMHYLFLKIIDNKKYTDKLIDDLIKYGVNQFVNDKNKVISLSYKVHEIKRKYIEIDEFDNSERKVLNLGHSFGHALEAFFDYRLPHGLAVLYGIVIAIDLSQILYKNTNNFEFNNTLIILKEKLLRLLILYSTIPNDTIFNSLRNNKERYLDYLSRDKKNINKDSFKIILFKSNTVKLVECNKEIMIKYLEQDNKL